MANEKRLIDANALADKVEESKYNNPHPQGMVRVNHRNEHDHFLRMILDAPTVDAVEVVHGRWEDEHGGKYANPRYRCSVCKARALYKFERDLLDNWKEVQALTPACPYCMAKLDGGIENDI